MVTSTGAKTKAGTTTPVI
ncbi:hypothetical protein D043_0439A, partial [Vibrio parahaemolyticus EKP-021]